MIRVQVLLQDAFRISSTMELFFLSVLFLCGFLDDSISKRAQNPLIAQLNSKSKHCSTTVDQPPPSRTCNGPVCREPCDLSCSPKQESINETKEANSSDYGDECVTNEGKKVEHQELDGTSSEDEEDKLFDGQSLDSFERAFRAVMNTRERLGGLDNATRRKMAEKVSSAFGMRWIFRHRLQTR